MRDIEVQKSSLLALQNSLTSASEFVNETVAHKMKENLSRIEERFQLIDLYFKPCDGDEQYNSLLCLFVEDVLNRVGEISQRYQSFVSKEKKVLPSEDDLSTEVKTSEVLYAVLSNFNVSFAALQKLTDLVYHKMVYLPYFTISPFLW